MANDRRQYEALKFTFTADDLRGLGQGLAREAQNVYDLEKREKEFDADIAAQIKGANGRVQDLTTKINNGYELREVEVLILFDEPSAGMKRVLRIDNHEIVREEAMTLEEKQRGFGFGE